MQRYTICTKFDYLPPAFFDWAGVRLYALSRKIMGEIPKWSLSQTHVLARTDARTCVEGCSALPMRWAKGAPKSPVLFWIREKGDKTHIWVTIAPRKFLLSRYAPTERFRDNTVVLIFLLVGFILPCFFLCITAFEEEHPIHLLNTLCITIDTCIWAHDILYSLDCIVYCYSSLF